MSKWFSVLAFVVSIFLPVIPVSAAASDTVLINEIRLGGAEIELSDGSEIQRYVTLYNAGSEAVSLDDWFLEYAENPGTALDPQFCEATTWAGFSDVTVVRTKLSGDLPAGAVTEPVELQLNDSDVGSLRLVHENDETIVHDLVGWGDSAPCKEVAPTAVPASGKSNIRHLDCDEKLPLDTNNNQEDFAVNQVSAPGKIGSTNAAKCADIVAESNCETVAITEMLPNPASTDTGSEFIEIHNPTAAEISLDGCGLFADGDEYWFVPGTTLGAGEYKAFYDSTTGIGLTNSKSVEVFVATKDEEFLQTKYPADLKDDISWALIDGAWQQTDNPTPSAANKPMTPEAASGKGGGDELDPCPAGKFRNPLTNRCKSIVLASSVLTPCKAGQARNSETNRCRSTTLASSTLTPCKPGQERNPATNRCRSDSSASGSLKPCDPDEERNPETNRCRKKQETLAAADIAGKVTDENKNMLNYGILGLVGTSAIGYGAYEYRNDLRNKLLKLRTKFIPDKSGK